MPPTAASPASAVAQTLSSITAEKIRPEVAPKLRRTPISRIRCRTVTSPLSSAPRPPRSSTTPPAPRTVFMTWSARSGGTHSSRVVGPNIIGSAEATVSHGPVDRSTR